MYVQCSLGACTGELTENQIKRSVNQIGSIWTMCLSPPLSISPSFSISYLFCLQTNVVIRVLVKTAHDFVSLHSLRFCFSFSSSSSSSSEKKKTKWNICHIVVAMGMQNERLEQCQCAIGLALSIPNWAYTAIEHFSNARKPNSFSSVQIFSISNLYT